MDQKKLLAERVEMLVVCGVLIAIILLAWWLGYTTGYNQGREDEHKAQRTTLLQRRLLYWRVNEGQPSLEYRYAPKVHDTCVKYGGAE